jgi:hypothetical protein
MCILYVPWGIRLFLHAKWGIRLFLHAKWAWKVLIRVTGVGNAIVPEAPRLSQGEGHQSPSPSPGLVDGHFNGLALLFWHDVAIENTHN